MRILDGKPLAYTWSDIVEKTSPYRFYLLCTFHHGNAGTKIGAAAPRRSAQGPGYTCP